MSGMLYRLVERSRAPVAGLRPRPVSRYEQPHPMGEQPLETEAFEVPVADEAVGRTGRARGAERLVDIPAGVDGSTADDGFGRAPDVEDGTRDQQPSVRGARPQQPSMRGAFGSPSPGDVRDDVPDTPGREHTTARPGRAEAAGRAALPSPQRRSAASQSPRTAVPEASPETPDVDPEPRSLALLRPTAALPPIRPALYVNTVAPVVCSPPPDEQPLVVEVSIGRLDVRTPPPPAPAPRPPAAAVHAEHAAALETYLRRRFEGELG